MKKENRRLYVSQNRVQFREGLWNFIDSCCDAGWHVHTPNLFLGMGGLEIQLA